MSKVPLALLFVLAENRGEELLVADGLITLVQSTLSSTVVGGRTAGSGGNTCKLTDM